MPDGVDADAIAASMRDGVLSLVVPKPERLKPRSIQIGFGLVGALLIAGTTVVAIAFGQGYYDRGYHVTEHVLKYYDTAKV